MNCCCSCVTEQTIKIPGSEGLPGTDGANGVDGANGANGGNAVAIVVTQTPTPTVPANGDSVTVIVSNGAWIVIGDVLMLQVGLFEVAQFYVLGLTPSGDNVNLILESIDGTLNLGFSMNAGYQFMPSGYFL